MKIHFLFLPMLMLAILADVVRAEGTIYSNSKFDEVGQDGYPAGWEGFSHKKYLGKAKARITVENEEGNAFFRLEVTEQTEHKFNAGRVVVPLATESKRFRVNCRMRLQNFVNLGEKGWLYPGVMMHFITANGQEVSAQKSWILIKENGGWTEFTSEVSRPAVEVEKLVLGLQPHGWTGILDLDDLVIEAIP